LEILKKAGDYRGLLKLAVRERCNIFISGGTSSGKTTFLNALLREVDANERLILIEDTPELEAPHKNMVGLLAARSALGEAVVSMEDLLNASLRMRPDRIVVGEVRDSAALDMLQAMNTGHDGSICTVHANSPRDALARIETMVLMAGVDLPMRAVREQVSSAIDLVIHQARFRDGSRRITHISEVVGMEGDIITMQELFRYEATNDRGGRKKKRDDDEDLDLDEEFMMEGDILNLETPIRDAIVLALPVNPLCDLDCLGLCPECGEKWATLPVDHAHEAIDPRWKALDGLDFPIEPK
jgi:hypothetical protein